MSDNKINDEIPSLGAFGYFSAIVLCCVVVGTLLYNFGREDQRRHDTPAAYAQAAKTDAQSICTERDALAMFECIYEKVESAQEQARDEQDLTAQQRAANSALVGAIIAFFTLILTGAGVWFVKQTLEATLKALEDTSRATEAVQKQNAISRDSLRAWVGFQAIDESVHTDNTWNGQFEDTAIGFTIAWKNFGTTPAFNLKCYANFVIQSGIAEVTALPSFNIPPMVGGILSPGSEFITERIVMSKYQTKLFRQREISVLLYARVEYRDLYSSLDSGEDERISEIFQQATHGGGVFTDKNNAMRDQITYKQVGNRNIMT